VPKDRGGLPQPVHGGVGVSDESWVSGVKFGDWVHVVYGIVKVMVVRKDLFFERSGLSYSTAIITSGTEMPDVINHIKPGLYPQTQHYFSSSSME
jgi:hypothetical protein